MNNKKLKFGCHNFLNSKPLTYPIEAGKIKSPFELIFDTPANLAYMLSEDKVDFAIIPSIEYARTEGLSLLRDFSISSRGKVNTVLLFCKKKPEQIKRVAVDKSSRTSIAMLKILFFERFKADPAFITCEPEINSMLKQADAALIIGDNAFKPNYKKYDIYDLGEEWFKLTARPFVHAVIAVREGVDIMGAEKIIRKSITMGLGSIAEIVKLESKRLNIKHKTCQDYLTNRIYYDFGADEISGLQYFFSLAKKYNLLDNEQKIRFYD